jgi:N utilization substance protein B
MTAAHGDGDGPGEPARPARTSGTGSGPRSVRPVVGGRSVARERAVHLLYEAEMKGDGGEAVLGAQVLAADPYTAELVAGVESHRPEIDSLISDLAPEGWAVARMATLDLAVLRIACFELAHRLDVPSGVVLSEAVALAEQYGTDESPRFVNGLLAAAARRLRPGA